MAKIITFQIDDSRAVAKLKLAQAAIANPRPLYATIGRTLVIRIRLCFKLGIDPWGRPWKPIKYRAPRTSAKTGKLTKAGREQFAANVAGTPGQPLRHTGRLNRSIVSSPSATGVTVGTNLIYAPVHQFGATITPKNKPRLVFPGPNGALIFAKKVVVPPRPFMPIRPGAQTAALPPEWALLVIRSVKGYLQLAGSKAEV